jgi:DNA-binding transcriptional LysR family regulator
VVANARSSWAGRRKITLAELVNERWILQPSGNVIRVLIEEAFRAEGLDIPGKKVSSVSMQLRTHLVATGRYLTIMPGSALRFNAKRWSLKVLPIKLQMKAVPTAIVTLKGRTLSPVVETFTAHARAVAKSLSVTA